ncbi:hypothetical protein F5X68DRAFT_226788 [Plectosphaerella plurivora]|uniref:Xylanolytic transcriptional activator regulatory domain-containing protein n=1 Tax=Plectosphaerella plurivora TaxID=936078 RepID=A0A9P9AGM2_9PEZI|nr:hypothetical protein F5X68DRAFT_226788 [Plectosphaerella plurivora]
MRQYFTHIQPMLPMLSETDFWEAFTTPTPHESKMSSLLLVQSMLFAACSTVSSSTLAQLGYSSTRQTRASFYRKAKLLYDMGVETSAMATAQAALLLTFWNPPSRADLKPNTMWLMIATENAKKAKADRYAESADAPMADPAKGSQLRRLWWCCIIRDRILPLGLRRSPQITSAHFDLEKNMETGYKDLQAEILRSKMHSEATLKTLAIIIERVVKLSVILTDVLLLAFPLKGAAHPDEIPQSQMKRCKAALLSWYETTPREIGDKSIAMRDPAAALHHAVMHIYFHWANIVMSHLGIRRAGIIQPRASQRRCIIEAQKEAQKSTVSIVENVHLLNELGLAEKLPITIAAFVAFPLAVHVFEATCSDMFVSKPRTAAERPLFRQRLSALVKAMKALHAQYDGVEEVVRNIRRIVDYVRLKSNNGEASDKGISSGQLFSDVALELRVSLAIDWSLSSGRPADGSDFTAYLGETFQPSPTAASEDAPTTPPDIRDIHEASTDGASDERATVSQQGGADWTASVPPLMADDTTSTWSNLYLPLQQYCFEPLEGDACPAEGYAEDPDIERMIDDILGDPGRAYFDDLFLPT